MKNIVLIGMMGCGKTTCGTLLSQKLNRTLVDTDAVIVQRENRSITEIFATDGEEYFRARETEVAKELGQQQDLIIATGGGLPLRWENAEALRQNGVVIWLKRDPASTFASESMEGRPLAQDGQAAFVQRFLDRTPKYQAASHVVIEDFTSPEVTVGLIMKAAEEAAAKQNETIQEESTMAQRITGHTELIGLIATPIRHSKSPMMHNTAFEALGLDYAYLAFDITQEQLDPVVKGLKQIARGFNVSMPYKTAIMDYLDVTDQSARLIGACNTVVNKDGKFYGYNTDGMGYMNGLKDQGYDPVGKKITVLGSGGAATAIVMQAAIDGVAEISIFNGNDPFFARAEHNAQVINQNTNCKANVYYLEDKERLKQEIASSYILANATNVGMGAMEGQKLIEDTSYLFPELIVTDVIYSPAETALLKMAREYGCRTVNGLPMMLYQGAAAFKLWTGMDMPIDAVKAVI